MDNDDFGFKPGDMEIIINALSAFPEIQTALIFGSRAKGNYKPGSDVDMAIRISGNDITWKLSGILNDETLLPYKFDVQNYDRIDNNDLIGHIDRVGIIFYSKTQGG